MKDDKVFGDVKKFTVKRCSWLRGSGCGMLQNNQNRKCCLGFYAQACGLTSKDIKGFNEPYDVCETYDPLTNDPVLKWNTILNNESINVCQELMVINDKSDISDEEREKQLTLLFKKIGI